MKNTTYKVKYHKEGGSIEIELKSWADLEKFMELMFYLKRKHELKEQVEDVVVYETDTPDFGCACGGIGST